LIRKLATVDMPVDAVKDLFQNVESWPTWMPFVTASTVMTKSERAMRVDLHLVQAGHEHRQTIEIVLEGDRVLQRQIEGPFKRYDGEWRFASTPDGSGTTLSLALDFEIGLIGAFIPKRVIQSTFDEFFAKMVDNVRARARAAPVAQREAQAMGQEAARETLLEVFRTPGGLEVWIGGQRHFIKAG